jgi:hypothetical protein
MKYDDIIVFLIYIILSLVLVLCRVQFDLCYFDKRPADDFKLTAFTESSLDHCLEECSRRSKCQAVGYHHLALFCELFSDSTTTSTVRGYVTVRREDMKLHDNVSILLNMISSFYCFCLNFIFYHLCFMSSHVNTVQCLN